jgi:hypothetical protein
MTESFDLSLYRLAEDAILLLDNINTAERLIKEGHRLMPDSVTIYFKDADRTCVICTKVRVRVVDDQTVIQWKDPYIGNHEDWRQVPLDEIRHIQGHWYK